MKSNSALRRVSVSISDIGHLLIYLSPSCLQLQPHDQSLAFIHPPLLCSIILIDQLLESLATVLGLRIDTYT